MHQMRLLSASLVLAFGLSACGGSDSTSAPAVPVASASSGVLVDDLIAGATVFCDDNSNGVLDAGEKSAVTDSAGAYAFSSACSSQIASVAETGYDLTTLKAPKGQFIAPAGSGVVSPFTTLKVVSGLSDTEFQSVLSGLGLAGVDVTSFNPFSASTDSARATTAAAVAKVLADIAELSAGAGGSPAAAFRGAVAAIATQARSSTTPVFASETSLRALVNAAVSAGLEAGNKDSSGNAVWSASQLAAAVDLSTQGLTVLAQKTREAASLSAAKDLLSSSAVLTLVGSVDLSDSSAVAAAKTQLSDATELAKPQYIYLSGDSIEIVPLQGKEVTATMTQFESSAGLTLSGQTLASLEQVWLPLTATSLALPKGGADLVLGIEIENTATGGILQARLAGVTLSRDSEGTVKAMIDDAARLHLYLKTGTGIEIGTGTKAITDISAKILCSCDSGVGIDLQKIADGLRKNFPDNTSLIDKTLAETGTFRVRMVATGADMRRADGTRLGLSRIAVRTPGSSATAAEVGGVAIQGRVTF